MREVVEGLRRAGQRVDKLAVRDVEAKGGEADLGGEEGHFRRANQPPCGVDDADRAQRSCVAEQGRPDVELGQDVDRSLQQRGRASGRERCGGSEKNRAEAGDRGGQRGGEAGRAAARHGNVVRRMIGHGHRGQDGPGAPAGNAPDCRCRPARLCERVPFRVLRLRAWVGMNGWTVVELGRSRGGQIALRFARALHRVAPAGGGPG